MSDYFVIDAAWLEREIANAQVLSEHAKGTGKPIAIAASAVRLESLKEVRKLGVTALGPGEGPISITIPSEPMSPERGES